MRNFPTLEAEKSVLGGVLLEGSKGADIACTFLDSEDFRSEANRQIFKAIWLLHHRRGELADLVAVTELLQQTDRLEFVGGPEYLAELIDVVPNGANIAQYCSLLKEASKQRARGAGAKHDNGKPCIHSILRYFPRALEAIARVNEHGAKNHGWNTWDTIDDAKNRYDDARLQHDLSEIKGEVTDEESGLLHAAHRAWGNLAVLELALREQKEC